MRFISLFFLATTIMMSVSLVATRTPNGAAEHDACSQPPARRPVMVSVPVNGKAAFSIEDLVARSTGITGCDDLGSDGATITVEQTGQGSLSLLGTNPQQVSFIPRHGFVGVSGVWALVIRDDKGNPISEIRVTFEVRNSVPVAADDRIVVPFEVSRLDVGPAMGVLANDLDDNGDRLVVYSQGVTQFPWGTVTIQHDGSYRIAVTDHELLGPAQVSYVVWDQQGSSTSVDHGVLSIDFEEAVVVED
jgi:hypothetical protein